jgi:hypothetical protein
MIKVAPASGTEPWQKDIVRNRVLLSVGKMKWHLTREEAVALAANLSKALAESEYQTYEGVVSTERRNIFLNGDDGTQLQVVMDYSLMEAKEKRVRVLGVVADDPRGGDIRHLHMKEWAEVAD